MSIPGSGKLREDRPRATFKAGLAVLVLSVGLATPIAAGSFEDARAAYNRGDYATALRLWLR
jgi:hypothetical protein